MTWISRLIRVTGLTAAIGVSSVAAGCGRSDAPPANATSEQAKPAVPESLPMGGAKSVMSFFVTSAGGGKGGDLGGLDGADALCRTLAQAQGAGDRTWRAYLSTMPSPKAPAVNARDRIGSGPWYNAEGLLVAANVENLHSDRNRISKATGVTERLDTVNGADDAPRMHDILTGSQPDGRAFPGTDDLTCGNWTSSEAGRAQVGHHDRAGDGSNAASWNSAHASRGCRQADLQASGGAGLFYCFAID